MLSELPGLAIRKSLNLYSVNDRVSEALWSTGNLAVCGLMVNMQILIHILLNTIYFIKYNKNTSSHLVLTDGKMNGQC